MAEWSIRPAHPGCVRAFRQRKPKRQRDREGSRCLCVGCRAIPQRIRWGAGFRLAIPQRIRWVAGLRRAVAQRWRGRTPCG